MLRLNHARVHTTSIAWRQCKRRNCIPGERIGQFAAQSLVRPAEPPRKRPERALADDDPNKPPREVSSPNNLVKFPVKSKRGRPRKTGADYRVSVEQVSKHTYAVRLRWMRADGVKDGVVVNRFRDDIVRRVSKRNFPPDIGTSCKRQRGLNFRIS